MRKFTAIGFLAAWASLSCALAEVRDSKQQEWAMVKDAHNRAHPAHPQQLLAKLKHDDPVSRGRVKQLLQRKGLAMSREYSLVPGLCLLSAPAGLVFGQAQPGQSVAVRKGQALKKLIEDLEGSGLFEYVEPDYIWQASREPEDEDFHNGRLWGLNNLGSFEVDIDPEKAWDITTGSRDVIVGVLDTGVLYSHNELEDQMWENPGEVPGDGIDNDENGYVDDVFGMNALSDGGNPLDDDGHGTHVAGTIAAAANGGGPVVGVAWDVRIMGLKVLGPLGGTSSDVMQGFEYGVEHGCKVINASLGGGARSQSMFEAIARAQRRGVLLVAAAGNSGVDTDIFPNYPSNYDLDNVISVAAIDRYGELAEFSNYGGQTVDIAAPGVDILSLGIDDDGAYRENSGTSMASPHVAGVAALLYSAFPNASAEEVRDRIISSAIPAAFSGQRQIVSGGRLSASEAFDIVPDGLLEMTVSPPSQSVLQTGSMVTVIVRVTDVFGVTNAVVEGTTLPEGDSISFMNDGVAPDVLQNDALYTAELTMPEEPGEYVFSVRAEAPEEDEKEYVSEEVRYHVVEPPGNDDFALSIKLPAEGTSQPFEVGDTRFATIECADRDGQRCECERNVGGIIDDSSRECTRVEPFHADVYDSDYSLWWTWTAAEDGEAFIDTVGSHYDTVIGVYTGNELAGLKPVASATDPVDPNETGNHAQLKFSTEQGQPYRIAVAGASREESGTLRFRLTPNGSADSTAPEVVIRSPVSGINSPEKRIELSGDVFDPSPNASGVERVRIRREGEVSSWGATGTTEWTYSVPLLSGRNVIEVTAVDFAGNVSETKAVEVNYFASGPSNNHFFNAELLEEISGEVRADIRGADKQTGEPHHAGNRGGASVWYAFTPPADGVLELEILRADFDTLLAVYTGAKVAELQHVASNDNAYPDDPDRREWSAISQAVRAGIQYWIALDGYPDDLGVADMRYAFTPGMVFDVSVENSPGGIVHPSGGVFAAGAEPKFQATPEDNFRFVRWEGDVESTTNPLTLAINKDFRLRAVFESSISDGFESGNLAALEYSFGGNQPWEVIEWSKDEEPPVPSFVGNFSARAGRIGDGESSSLILRAEAVGGMASFDFRVSSEEGWDFLEFYINGEVDTDFGKRWGEVPWRSYEFVLPPGNVELEWRYSKDRDPASQAGEDTAYIDNLILPFERPKVVAPRLFVDFVPAGIQLRIEGESGRSYQIESSENLLDWSPFGVEPVNNEVIIDLSDPEFEGTQRRFFRAVAQ